MNPWDQALRLRTKAIDMWAERGWGSVLNSFTAVVVNVL